MTVKISNLPAATSVGSGDVIPVVQSGTTKKIDLNSPWNINIDGGNIDGTPIGVSSASSGAFTTLTASDDVNFDSGTLFVDASADQVLVGTTTAVAANQVLEVKGASPTDAFSGQLSLVASETSGAVNTGSGVIFNGHDGAVGRTSGYIRSLKENGTSGNSAFYMSFGPRPNGGSPTERMRIDSSGNVLIGTTATGNFWDGTPFGSVRISSAGSAKATIESTNNGDASLHFNSISGTSTDFWHRIRLDKTNKYLEFSGADQSTSSYVPASYMTTAGAWYQGNNSSSWSTTSDARIKENIRPISNALDKIDALKPCHFEYKTRQGKVKTGFIAQEFEQVLPGHITEELPIKEFEGLIPSGEKLKAIDLDLIPYLVKAIQELKAELDELKGVK